MYTVIRGVSLSTQAPMSQPRKRNYPLEEMDVGDAFFIPSTEKRAQLATYFWQAGRKLNRKFSVRKTTMAEGPNRVWAPCEPDHEDAVLGLAVIRIA